VADDVAVLGGRGKRGGAESLIGYPSEECLDGFPSQRIFDGGKKAGADTGIGDKMVFTYLRYHANG
jgi:hypothetical protein